MFYKSVPLEICEGIDCDTLCNIVCRKKIDENELFGGFCEVENSVKKSVFWGVFGGFEGLGRISSRTSALKGASPLTHIPVKHVQNSEKREVKNV